MDRLFGSLNLGIRRLLFAVAIVWWLGGYLVFPADVGLWWTSLGATPRTVCADVYARGDPRLSDCEYAAPGGFAENYIRQQNGKSAPFEFYRKKNANSDLIWWWIFAPALFLAVARLGHWVLQGFKSDADTDTKSAS